MVLADIIKCCIASILKMRIVIIGEFSSFSKNLSEGFRAIGHECFVFSWGDDYKKILQNKEFAYQIENSRFNPPNSIYSRLRFMIHSWHEFKKLKLFVSNMSKSTKYDAALIINPSFIKYRYRFWQALFTSDMVRSIVRNPQNIYLSACGTDVPFYTYWKDKKWKNASMMPSFEKFGHKERIRHHKYVISFAKKIIPVMYGYAEAWRKSKYSQSCIVLETIPLPINCSTIPPTNDVTDKIVIFHGITRPEVKGSGFIVKAMEKLQAKYPDLVECRSEGGMPLEEYLHLIKKTNIQIDQACCEYVGMNGLYGLAMGKVVLGGNELENQQELNEPNCPIVNIIPDSDQICNELEKLILNKELIMQLSKKSREYVERVHDAKVIASRYIHLFSSFNE